MLAQTLTLVNTIFTMKQPTITYQCLRFKSLKLKQLYEIIRLREAVFVVEQDCPYLEADGKDPQGWHVLGYQGKELVAYTRILPKRVSYNDATSIGRVVTKKEMRGQGIGVDIMKYSLDWINRLFPQQRIRISAQTYLTKFYQKFGFQPIGNEYLEDNIPHIQMVIEPKAWK